MKISFNNKKYNTIAFYSATIILFAILCWNFIIVHPVGLSSLWDGIAQIVKTLFYALIVAYILAPLMDFFNHRALGFIQKKRKESVVRKLIALFLTVIVFLAIITVFVWFVTPQIIKNINSLGGTLKGYYNSADSFIRDLRQNSALFDRIYTTVLQSEGNLGDLLTKGLSSMLSLVSDASSFIIAFISSFVNEVKTIFMGMFLAVYFLYYKEMLISQISRFGKAFLRPRTRDFVAHIIEDIDVKFAKFLRGKAFDSLLIGVILYIIYKIIGINYAEILALVGGVMNMIPVFGPLISGFICGFILLLTAPHQILPYLIVVIVVALIDSNFIEPKLLGDSLGLKPVWITIAIMVMSSLFGFFGMFFGVPIFAVIYTLIKEAVDNRVAQREAREAHEAALHADHTSDKDPQPPQENIESNDEGTEEKN